MNQERTECSRNEARGRQATDWLVRHEADAELSPAATQAWDEWIGDPENSAEYDRTLECLQGLRQLPAPALRTTSEVLADRTAVELPENRRYQFLGIAAALALILSVGIVISVLRLSGARDEYATARAEQRAVQLQEGTTITLAADSVVRVHYTAEQRTVMLERGEALFQVRRIPGRPFVVLAGHGRITALGTEFDVRLSPGQVRVAVTDGAVEVAPRYRKVNDGARWIPLRLARGQQMSYGAHEGATAPQSSDVTSATAWTRGSIEYRGRALKEVIEDVQRYTPQRILLDPSAEDLQFSGIFVERNADQWIRLLPKVLPLDVISEPDEIRIRLRGRKK